jgi:hypothetical protein
MPQKTSLQKHDEETGILSAIWILASNSETSLMNYKFIRHRMEIPTSFEVEKLISKHPELFRLKVPISRLNLLKQEMLAGKKMTAWLMDISDENERKKAIESLTPEDCFRSQFRTESDAPRSPIEIIDWGLQHIERLRKAKLEEKEIRWKWLKEGVIPTLSILVALAAIIASSLIQSANIDSQENLKKYELDTQEKLKKYEISFNQRNDNYVSIMESFESSLKSVESRDKTKLQISLEQIEFSYYKIRPFLRKEAQIKFSETFAGFSKYLNELSDNELTKNLSVKEQETYKTFKSYFVETLYEELFEKSNYVTTSVLSPTR